MAAGRIKKPNGKLYRNTDADWAWLQGGPAKCARWLGYVPFASITDNRADAPTIREAPDSTHPYTYVSAGLRVEIPDGQALAPIARCAGFSGRQPYRLVIFGEKSSLADVVAPIAADYDADLFLETGEISDSHIYEMAAAGAADGRPLRVFTLADCDPAGWQMPVSIGRKLQALRDLEFHALDFAVIPVALTVDQVRAMDLPSTPLKDSELRADKWRTAWGIEQTEIDALATLRPQALTDLLIDALKPFYDDTLTKRVALAEFTWRQQAQAVIDDHVDKGELNEIREELESFEGAFDALNSRLLAMVADVVLPETDIPDAVIDPTRNGTRPLVASAWNWAEQTRRLKAWKAYTRE